MSSQYDYALFSDLDRTILPNGSQPESPQARPLLRTFVQHETLLLAYVSGRHLQLIREAIADYNLPVPAYAVGDVGSTIYRSDNGDWHAWQAWRDRIAPDWNGACHDDLRQLFADLALLTPQESAKQNEFKLSYYAPVDCDYQGVIDEMQSRLRRHKVSASIVWSIDEAAHIGLLDVLPASATKLHAVEYLMAYHEIPVAQAVFAGDSGNDLPVIASGQVQAVLVRNAHSAVIKEAEQALRARSALDRLYVARGDFRGMNGNYSAGVLEGCVHFLPQCAHWLET